VYVGCEVAQVAETALCTIATAGHCVGEKFSHSRWEAEMYGANFRDPEKGRFGCYEHFDSGPRPFETSGLRVHANVTLPILLSLLMRFQSSSNLTT
jgi:hypothetical protein